ncbi:hypothetical protein M0805_001636 [Coniferiporia weirii]|nr:hypothetical protein M0805_001636 [Coniferiporia weirii]
MQNETSLSSNRESSGQILGCQSAFQRALDSYLNGLPEHKQKKNFIATCYDPAHPVTPDAVNKSIERIEADKSSRSSTISKLFRRFVSVLKDYDGIINTLASADPMPTAIIWGALSVVINSAQRFYNIFDTIKKELRNMANELVRISEFEALFGDCTKLQEHLCKLYINMFRFWSRVYKELNQPGFKSFASATFSFSIKKLDGIIEDIRENADEIEKQADILLKKKMLEEQKNAGLERDAQSGFRKRQEDERLVRTVSKQLSQQRVTIANLSRHAEFREQHMDGTCNWLAKRTEFEQWWKRSETSPVLWLHAPPGSGKSTLCSYVIQFIEESDPTKALAYHFYRFDEPSKPSEVLQHMAYQLFQKYSASTWSSDVLQDLTDTMKVFGESSLRCAQEIITTLVKNLPGVYLFLDGLDEESARDRWKDAETVIDFLQKLARESPDTIRVWCSSQNIPCVYDKFNSDTCSILDVREETRTDMMTYLSNKLAYLQVSKEDSDMVLRKNSKEGASGNFLWARLMIEDLISANSPADRTRIIKEGPTLDDYYMRFFQRLEEKDRSLACYIFALVAFARRPLRVKELREAVGMLKSRDAQSGGKSSSSLDPSEKPYIKSILKLFAPLIEVESDCGEMDDRICRLYHSTVLDFLRRNAEIFYNSSKSTKRQTAGLRISPAVIADACLLYLSQDRYSHLLTRSDNVWSDATGTPVAEHHFLTYSAKYWDRHLDCLQVEIPSVLDAKNSKELCKTQHNEFYKRVRAFLRSPNFQVCIQIQSLWVDSQFEVFRVNGDDENRAYLRRVFPDWFTRTPYGRRFLVDYRRFWYNWRLFLGCGHCDEPTCVFKACTGEIDRCWWAALGPHNLLSAFQSRYISFRFQSDEDTMLTRASFEGVGVSGNELIILRLNGHQRNQLEFICESWCITTKKPPVLRRKQTIVAQEDCSNWLQYARRTGNHLGLCDMRKDRALPAAFSNGCQFLRIGTQIYARDEAGDYSVISVPSTRQGQYPAYIEEITGRENFIVLATRRGAIAQTKLQSEKADESTPSTPRSGNSKDGVSSLVGTSKSGDEGSGDKNSESSDIEQDDIDEDSDDEGTETDDDELDGIDEESSNDDIDGENSGDDVSASEDSNIESDGDDEESESSYETDDEAYETWSECSSGDTDDSQDEDDLAASCHDFGNDGNRSDSYDSQSSGEEVEENEESDSGSNGSSDSSTEEPDVSPQTFGYGQWRRYGEDSEHNLSDYEGWRSPSPTRKKSHLTAAQSKGTKASITVFDTRAPVPEKAFSLSMNLSLMLYGSPPVVHPLQPLVVWPLGSGDVLFADFQANTYFIRKLKPSTLFTRHIFMKCHFSVCGGYLHIASLEGRREPIAKREKRKDEAQPVIKLALLVSTYRLCSKKPSRAPPSLIHRERIELRAVTSLTVSKLPFTLTWMPRELYFTCSDIVLKVYRISLFDSEGTVPGDKNSVLRPREIICLPNSAQEREVYFFPPADGDKTARIIIGSEVSAGGDTEFEETGGVRLNLSPPIGCILHEKNDLGGWISSSDHSDSPKKEGVGRLDRPLEKFNPEEDCDLEPFLFLGW